MSLPAQSDLVVRGPLEIALRIYIFPSTCFLSFTARSPVCVATRKTKHPLGSSRKGADRIAAHRKEKDCRVNPDIFTGKKRGIPSGPPTHHLHFYSLLACLLIDLVQDHVLRARRPPPSTCVPPIDQTSAPASSPPLPHPHHHQQETHRR